MGKCTQLIENFFLIGDICYSILIGWGQDGGLLGIKPMAWHMSRVCVITDQPSSMAQFDVNKHSLAEAKVMLRCRTVPQEILREQSRKGGRTQPADTPAETLASIHSIWDF